MKDPIARRVASRVLANDIRMSDSFYKAALQAWDAGEKGNQSDADDEKEYNREELKEALAEAQRALKGVANGKRGEIQNLTANVWQLCYFAGALNGAK